MNHQCKNRWRAFSVAVVFLAFSIPLMAAEPVVVGVVHREDFAYANMMRTAYEMALEEINATDGINGRPLELVFADDRGDAKVGELAIGELVQRKKLSCWWGGIPVATPLRWHTQPIGWTFRFWCARPPMIESPNTD